jgi:hypothetical protein
MTSTVPWDCSATYQKPTTLSCIQYLHASSESGFLIFAPLPVPLHWPLAPVHPLVVLIVVLARRTAGIRACGETIACSPFTFQQSAVRHLPFTLHVPKGHRRLAGGQPAPAGAAPGAKVKRQISPEGGRS